MNGSRNNNYNHITNIKSVKEFVKLLERRKCRNTENLRKEITTSEQFYVEMNKGRPRPRLAQSWFWPCSFGVGLGLGLAQIHLVLVLFI